MHPRFLMPTWPVDDFSSSENLMFQSLSFFVRHETSLLNLCMYFNTIFKFSRQSLDSVASRSNAARLESKLLHFGAEFTP